MIGGVALLIAMIAGLVGLVIFPVVNTTSNLIDTTWLGAWMALPLFDIVKLLPLVFIGLCILGVVWAVSRM